MSKMPLSGFLIAGGILAALYLYRASQGSPSGLLSDAAHKSPGSWGVESSDFGHPGTFTPVQPEPAGASPHREGSPWNKQRWEEFYREFPEVGPGSQPLDPALRGG